MFQVRYNWKASQLSLRCARNMIQVEPLLQANHFFNNKIEQAYTSCFHSKYFIHNNKPCDVGVDLYLEITGNNSGCWLLL